MKYTIELLDGQRVEVTAGPASVFAGTTPDGFRCLVFVRSILQPEGSPDEEFGLKSIENPGVSEEEIERLAKVAFPDGWYVAGPPRGKTVAELKEIADDRSADPALRVEAIDLMRDVELGELASSSEFWRRAHALFAKRDARPPR